MPKLLMGTFLGFALSIVGSLVTILIIVYRDEVAYRREQDLHERYRRDG